MVCQWHVNDGFCITFLVPRQESTDWRTRWGYHMMCEKEIAATVDVFAGIGGCGHFVLVVGLVLCYSF